MEIADGIAGSVRMESGMAFLFMKDFLGLRRRLRTGAAAGAAAGWVVLSLGCLVLVSTGVSIWVSMLLLLKWVLKSSISLSISSSTVLGALLVVLAIGTDAKSMPMEQVVL